MVFVLDEVPYTADKYNGVTSTTVHYTLYTTTAVSCYTAHISYINRDAGMFVSHFAILLMSVVTKDLPISPRF